MENNNKWQSAAFDGLLLSAVTIVYSLITSLFTPGVFLSLVLWAVKFGGCIWLLHYFMKKYSSQFRHITYGESFQYGMLISLFSSIVCAGFLFISLTLLFPGQLDLAVEQSQEMLAQSNYSGEQIEAVNAVMGYLPQITLLWTLVYYFIIGVIMAAITANFTKRENIFDDATSETEKNEGGESENTAL